MQGVNRSVSLVLILIGLFVSYNLDLECVLASDIHCQMTSCHDADTDDICAEPSLSSPPVVAILVRDFQLEPRVLIQKVRCAAYASETEIFYEPRLKIPIGLRAPPVSVS